MAAERHLWNPGPVDSKPVLFVTDLHFSWKELGRRGGVETNLEPGGLRSASLFLGPKGNVQMAFLSPPLPFAPHPCLVRLATTPAPQDCSCRAPEPH